MNISKNEIGLIKRMLDVYEKEMLGMNIKETTKNEELEEIQALREKIEADINERKGKRGN